MYIWDLSQNNFKILIKKNHTEIHMANWENLLMGFVLETHYSEILDDLVIVSEYDIWLWRAVYKSSRSVSIHVLARRPISIRTAVKRDEHYLPPCVFYHSIQYYRW